MSDRRKDAALANRSGEAGYRPVQQSIARTIIEADNVSLKRLAWAYGCAPKGSSEEAQLEMLLLARVRPEAEAERNEAREHAEVCLAQMVDWMEFCGDLSIENAKLRSQVNDLERRLVALNKAPAEGVGP